MTTPRFVLELREKIGNAPLWMPGGKGVVLRAGADGPEVLLVQRRDNGRWTVPAGILEPGEEPADGIAREVLEETGVVARPLRLVGVQTTQPTEYPNGDRAQYLDVVMALEAEGGEARVNDDENLAVAWRPVARLDDVPPLHRRAIEWARSQDPRYADGESTGGGAYFVHDGAAKRA
ncbi:NUDIX domain-containing protein [Galactobacter valiniphilus]|uniref:NUDIX domain-containing protein n=1 Tax=Galactobacter valiniphilus TaxID=2676122 RepID=A0A399JBF9_9MICC|nr:NUDIX domain-containing protein [Galactobacter valiniphilus]RII42905.1 NUDIX domain-containing protein [Galactobacter valiniphilus]